MRLLITAGPTREYLDDVRYLSNASSGRMGYAIASAAVAAGHEVVLISGPVALAPPGGHGMKSALIWYPAGCRFWTRFWSFCVSFDRIRGLGVGFLWML